MILKAIKLKSQITQKKLLNLQAQKNIHQLTFFVTIGQSQPHMFLLFSFKTLNSK